MAAHNDLGHWGETLAAKYLQGQGYCIVYRDWRYGHRDLDIVAMDKESNELVIVEVKTRRDEKFCDADTAVTPQKIRSLSIAANAFVKSKMIDADIRFDIITIVGTDESSAEIRHVKDAFLPFV